MLDCVGNTIEQNDVFIAIPLWAVSMRRLICFLG